MVKVNSWGSDEPVEESKGGTATASATTGDILYSDASNSLAKLGIGSTNQILTVETDVPAWETASGGSAGWTPISTATASASTSVDFDSTVITSTYDIYLIVCFNHTPTSDSGFYLRFSPDNGSTVRATGYVCAVSDQDNNTPTDVTTQISITETAMDATAGDAVGLSYIMVTNPAASGIKTSAMSWIGYWDTTQEQYGRAFGRYDTAETHNFFTLLQSTDTIATATVYLYGMTKP